MHCVVVIPHHPARLPVREVIVLVLPRGGGVLGPTIKGSARIGSVEVNGAVGVGVVDEANDGFGPSWHHDGGTGRDAIVADKIGGTEVRVDGVLEGLDLNLVVMHKPGNRGVGIGKVRERGGHVGQSGDFDNSGRCQSDGRDRGQMAARGLTGWVASEEG